MHPSSLPPSRIQILIFVPGLADIDKVCETFMDLAPGLVVAPSAKLTGV